MASTSSGVAGGTHAGVHVHVGQMHAVPEDEQSELEKLRRERYGDEMGFDPGENRLKKALESENCWAPHASGASAATAPRSDRREKVGIRGIFGCPAAPRTVEAGANGAHKEQDA